MNISPGLTLSPHYSVASTKANAAKSDEQSEKAIVAPNKIEKINDEEKAQTEKSKSSDNKAKLESELTQEEIEKLRELRQRDREVRAHEQAHAAVAGSLAKGAPSFDYERGPDGQLYAVGGEVQIDTSAVPGDPEATAEKAQQIRRAALAPANPSQQDRAVAAAASALEAKARVEMAKEKVQDAVEAINDKFAAEENRTEDKKISESEASAKSEVDNKCAQCGGQHSAESHNVSVQLNETFVENSLIQQNINQFNFAI
jgi:membrane-associated HD superfamily phosphohydrolase